MSKHVFTSACPNKSKSVDAGAYLAGHEHQPAGQQQSAMSIHIAQDIRSSLCHSHNESKKPDT